MSKNIFRIAVFDPALHASSGHHFALLQSLKEREADLTHIDDVKYFCHENMRDRLEKEAGAHFPTLTPFFNTDFYRYNCQRPSLIEVNSYIAHLSREYLNAFKVLLGSNAAEQKERERGSEGKTIVLYPAMQWEHLLALYLAIAQYPDALRPGVISHKICMMYNPGRSHTGSIISSREWVGYRLALRALESFPAINFYASDYELVEHFSCLIGDSRKIGVHPQYLFPLNVGASVSDKKIDINQSGCKIGLYFGDAKADKGFLRLPELTRELLECVPENSEVIIQYSTHSTCGRIAAVEAQLRIIAKRDFRLKLYPSHIPNDQLFSMLRALDIFVFNYCSKAYAEKSSGFVWLLSGLAVDCTLFFAHDGWIYREAQRLGLQTHFTKNGSVSSSVKVFFINGRTLGRRSKISLRADVNTAYKELVFSDFVRWLTE
ncbi:hypothetical protein KUV95_11800 [Microbulbifer agarilyticus]|uniref:hypothetical protein n=1 Tax=Microbulbifer agarilyticus TaxID=260552 RepID=UPI001C948ED1|nr:hypothetical protein [Microbulbifer agarilyticus]MBY6212235.1 hypothetical protein [Microbulbifer agarilyticus]